MDPNRLKSIPVFSKLEDADLRRIATFATEKSAGAGDCLMREGDFSEDLMVIEEGEASVRRGDEEIATLKAGDFFGEIGVLEKSLRTATVTAKSPVRLIILSHWDLKRVGNAIEQIRATLADRKRMQAQAQA